MRRAIIGFLLASLPACIGAADGSTAPGPRPGGSVASSAAIHTQGGGWQPIRRFRARLAHQDLRRLAGRIGPRPAGSFGYRRAVGYVRRILGDLGYQTKVQSFALPQGGRSRNVLAIWPGSPPPRLLIGGHLDTVRGSPGANDNASGVATILGLARALAGSAKGELVRLVAFGAEEVQPGGRHHIGSTAYVRRMSSRQRRRLDLMVSADMIGQVRPYVAGYLEGTGPWGARKLARAAHSIGLAATVTALPDISDHGPFARAGMSAAFMWTGDEPNHHQPTDVVRHVRPKALRRDGRTLIALIRRVL